MDDDAMAKLNELFEKFTTNLPVEEEEIKESWKIKKEPPKKISH